MIRLSLILAAVLVAALFIPPWLDFGTLLLTGLLWTIWHDAAEKRQARTRAAFRQAIKDQGGTVPPETYHELIMRELARYRPGK